MKTIVTAYTPDRALVYVDVKDFTVDKDIVTFKKDDQHVIKIINCPIVAIDDYTDEKPEKKINKKESKKNETES